MKTKIQSGIDIVKISRIHSILNSKNRNRFIQKIFTENEIVQSKERFDEVLYFSGRFAAKEALKKAFSDNTYPKHFKSFEILADKDGKPNVFYEKKNLENTSLSISHDGNYAVAHCVTIS
jgi:holo-[acyl-carrier protein] synthase